MAERDLYIWVKTEAQSKTSSKAVGSIEKGLSVNQSSFLGKHITCTKNLRVTVNENFLGIFS